MEWKNIEHAPVGRIERQEIKQGGKIIVKDVFIPELVITASKCGKVFVSNRLQNGRWHGYATGELPVGYMELPKHPQQER